MLRGHTEIVAGVEVTFENVRIFFERQLEEYDLSDEQLLMQNLSELDNSLDRLENLAVKGTYFANIHIRVLARKQLRIVSSLDEAHFTITIEPVLRSKRKLINRLKEKHLVQSVEDVRKSIQGTSILILKGGGIKGLAFVGALQVLEKYGYQFDTFVGTSAGAITATLLAGGLSSTDLEELLRKTQFNEFLDAGFLGACWNLVSKGGLFPGEKIQLWIEEVLKSKIEKAQQITLSDLTPNRAVLFAADNNQGPIQLDSTSSYKDLPAAFAARCSMSLPYIFTTVHIGGNKVIDGGILANFPLEAFFARENTTRDNFIGIYLGNKNVKRKPATLIGYILNIIFDRGEKRIIDDFKDNIITIDPTPIGTLDFYLSKEEKNFLFYEGVACATKFLSKFDSEMAAEAQQTREVADEARASAIIVRNKRRLMLKIKSLSIIATIFLIIFLLNILFN